jgi:subtilisin family serine protease
VADVLSTEAWPGETGSSGAGPGKGRTTSGPSDERPTAAFVTLITGDRVRLVTRDGHTIAVPMPGPGREGIQFAIHQRGERIEVVPSDAAPFLLQGKLDRRLFQVTDLVAAGYDDAAMPRLPVIVQYAPGQRSVPSPRTVRAGHTLASVRATAYTVRKTDAGGFWRWLAGPSAGQPGRTTPSGGAFESGVAKVWLDGPVHASLDQSVPQTKAPQAWELGFTGKGVTVAILDSGIDNDHPDLQGAVVAERNFITGGDEARDGLGHGTHVAGIVTGSGAASGGRYRGMAPDAVLLDGKVLDDEGTGTESSLIAGMEWAAAQDARIVNMSISTWNASDGTDPVSLALNRLSTDDGPLFVVAAGNNGSSPFSVGSPGAADAALTVGAVDSEGRTAEFSSRGPRAGDVALKPDIAAPGVGIVSARATGTEPEEPVGEHYARMSGTSMAAPHVAGAAALLAQLRPTWTPAQLKAVLTSTASPTPGEGVFDQGAGQLDAARAVTQRVNAEQANLSMFMRWPHQAPRTQTLTYRNTSATDVTLTLQLTVTDAEGEPAPDGLVTLDRTTLVVPARGRAQVEVTVDPRKGEAGSYYGGRITAQGSGDVVIQTPLAVSIERESYDLTLRILDRNGELVERVDEAFLVPPFVADPESGRIFDLRAGEEGLVARVPKGTYTFSTILVTRHGPIKPPSFTHLADPIIAVAKDVTITLDARAAERVQATVEARDARTEATTFGTTELLGGYPSTTFVEVPGAQRSPLYALATEPVTDRTYLFVVYQVMATDDATYELVVGEQGRVPDDPTYAVRNADLFRDEATFARPGADIDWWGSWTRFAELPGGTTVGVGRSYDVPVPGSRTHLASARFDSDVLLWSADFDAGPSAVDIAYTEFDLARSHAPGSRVRRAYGRAAFRPQGDGASIEGLTSLWFTPGNPSPGQGPFSVWSLNGVEGRVTLARDGEVIAESADPFFLDTEVPLDGRHTYVVELTATQDVPWSRYATSVDARWTFPMVGPVDDVRLPLLNVAATGDFDLTGRAPAGEPFVLELLPLPAEDVGQVTSVTLDVSYDDGETWRQASVTRTPAGRWRATVTHPDNPGGFVSLRLRAHDNRGHRVQWTSIRAYGLVGGES